MGDHYVYELCGHDVLEGDLWYVGTTRNVATRLAQHHNGECAATRGLFAHVVERAVVRRWAGMDTQEEAAQLELQRVLELAEKHGVKRVFGSRFSSWPRSSADEAELCLLLDTRRGACYTCHKSGHVASDCPRKRASPAAAARPSAADHPPSLPAERTAPLSKKPRAASPAATAPPPPPPPPLLNVPPALPTPSPTDEEDDSLVVVGAQPARTSSDGQHPLQGDPLFAQARAISPSLVVTLTGPHCGAVRLAVGDALDRPDTAKLLSYYLRGRAKSTESKPLCWFGDPCLFVNYWAALPLDDERLQSCPYDDVKRSLELARKKPLEEPTARDRGSAPRVARLACQSCV